MLAISLKDPRRVGIANEDFLGGIQRQGPDASFKSKSPSSELVLHRVLKQDDQMPNRLVLV